MQGASKVSNMHAYGQVGVGMSIQEQRSHFALWALLKAPLLVSADLGHIDPEALAILRARELIAVNQDPLGVAGDLIWKEGPLEVSPLCYTGRGNGCSAIHEPSSLTRHGIKRNIDRPSCGSFSCVAVKHP